AVARGAAVCLAVPESLPREFPASHRRCKVELCCTALPCPGEAEPATLKQRIHCVTAYHGMNGGLIVVVGIHAVVFEEEAEFNGGGILKRAFVAIDAKESSMLVDDLAMLYEALDGIGGGTPCARGFLGKE